MSDPSRQRDAGHGHAGHGRRAAGELESEVLAALWAAQRPLTPGEVRLALGAPPAYNTILTILLRLHDKGLVERERSGRAHAYRPTVAHAELAAERMRSLLGSADPVAVLQRFVAGLSPAEETALRRLLRKR